ncbi:MAG: hypothetical protein QXD43_01540 [Candidatus Aenigmatarchaeota archaeon]
MAEDQEYIDEFLRLPSKTGKDVIDLEKYAKLPRTKTYESIIAFLEEARKSKEVTAIFIKAEWGEGKTSIYEGLLKKPEIIKSDLVIPVTTKRLINVIKEDYMQFLDTKSPGIRFFACLLYAIKDVIDVKLNSIPPFNKINISFKKNDERTIDFISNGLSSIFNNLPLESRIFIFLDEFEDIVDEKSDIQSFIRAGLVEMINGEPYQLCEGPYAGRLHLIFATTPVAYEKMKGEVHSDTGRLYGGRIKEVELEKLDRKNSYEFALGVLNYCWDGKLPRIPFNEPGMFNAIYLATLGNPRAIINILEHLIASAKYGSPEKKIKVLNIEDFIWYLSEKKIQVYGGEINILDGKSLNMLYDKVAQECKKRGIDPEKGIKLIQFLLSNPTPISENEIKKKFNLTEDYETYLGTIGKSFEDLWYIKPFIFFKKVIKGQEEIKFKKAPPKFFKLTKAFEFYNYDTKKASFISELFVPYEKLDEMRYNNETMFKNFITFVIEEVPEISDEDEIIKFIDLELFKVVEVSNDNYIMLSSPALNIFYPSPSIFFLDFIEDINKRFEIGMELMRNLTSYENQFHEGILKLLEKIEETEDNIKIKEEIERYGLNDINLANMLYKSIAWQYKLRFYIFTALKFSLTSAQDNINRIIEKMKIANIPLLITFSWNPLPLDVKSFLETSLGLKKEERIFHYIDFALTTIQCHQIVGYVLAENKKYKINYDKWSSKAKRIIEELQFEDKIKEWIYKGLEDGYTIKLLNFKQITQKDVTKALRIFLITSGSLRERYNQINELEKYKIFGKEFSVCPIDVESPDMLKQIANDLSDNGLITRIGSDEFESNITEIERRILTILRQYNKPMKKDEINNLFVCIKQDGHFIDTSLYLDMLIERKLVRLDREETYSIQGIENLKNTLNKLRSDLREFNEIYQQYTFGYLFSKKKYDTNGIILKDFLKELNEVNKSI